MNDHLVRFLSEVPPFDTLDEKQLKSTARSLSKVHYYRGMVLFVQDKTAINSLYIVMEGRLERYILENGEKVLHGFLEAKDTYGALSILFNKGLSISTIRCVDDVTFYCLPKDKLLDLCYRNSEFLRMFTSEFTEKMEQKPYVEHLVKTPRSIEEKEPQSFLHRPLSAVFSREIVSCPQTFSIQKAAQAMTQRRKDAIVIIDASGLPFGLLTDHDLREKVVAGGYDIEAPVEEVASSPLLGTSVHSQVFEALLMMMQYNIRHLVVFDDHGELYGVITDQDLLLAQGQSPVFLVHEIQVAASVEEISIRLEKLPQMVMNLLESGAKAEHLNHIITAISDAALLKIVGFAQDALGPPPAKFAFMILGSEGRKEQTLKTDQDNAIVYEDVDPADAQDAKEYFLRLGEKICDGLNQAGFSFCEYEIMARNPQWCQPVSVWKDYFWKWIYGAEPESLLFASIFFDFRWGAGEKELMEELWAFLNEALSGWAGFFRHLAENALYFKPPLDFFGNITLQSKGRFKNRLDIKSPMRLVVDFARIYALQHNIRHTNTADRLNELYLRAILDPSEYEDLLHSHNFLMRVRLAHQAHNIIENQEPPDNYIDPKTLSHIDQQSLKEAFKCIRSAQARLRMEFVQYTGIA